MNNKYVTYTGKKDGNEIIFIRSKEKPYFVGRVSTMPDNTWHQPISGYNLFVCYNGTADGNFFPVYKNSEQDVSGVLYDMASFYLQNDIQSNPGKFVDFKIVSNEVQATVE